jgi:hypothetical protein
VIERTKVLEADVAGEPDLASEPWTYPGRPASGSGLLQGGTYRSLTVRPNRRLGQAVVNNDASTFGENLNYALLQANVAAVDARHLVVAIGSNAAPAVIHRKLAREGVNGVVPFVAGQVSGVVLGHSAHVSAAGYFAATPLAAPDLPVTLPVFASLLDDEQLTCIDNTEPNYDRILVTDPSMRLLLESGEAPESYWMYVSTWGLLGPSSGPVGFGTQERVFGVLTDRLSEFGALGLAGDLPSAMRRLASDDGLRRQVSDELAVAGWVHASGFPVEPGPRHEQRYGATPAGFPEADDASQRMVVVSSRNDLQRMGEQCIALHPDDIERGGWRSHVAVHSLVRRDLAPAITRLVRSDSCGRGTVELDQVVRNALGLELQEQVRLEPALVRHRPVIDLLVARPHFSMVRVQAADLASVEQNIGLMTPVAMNILGLSDGDRVVLQGAPISTGQAEEVRISVHAAPDEMVQRRVALSGGGLSSRFPGARDALGVYPDLPWIFLDASTRERLGLTGFKLPVVRARASRRFQVGRELRELLLLWILAFVGLATVVSSRAILAAILCLFVLLGVFVIRSRIKQRLETVDRPPIRRLPSRRGQPGGGGRGR